MSCVELYKKENLKNASVFSRLFAEEEQFDNAGEEIGRITDGDGDYDTHVIHIRNPKYVWLNLNYFVNPIDKKYYDRHVSHVPTSVKKYFNNSNDRCNYKMCGDAFLEIFYFPKSEFVTFESFVKHLEQNYLTFIDKNLQLYDYTFEHCSERFSISDKQETVISIQDLYCIHFSHFYGLEEVLQLKTTNALDFLPEGKGYDNKPQVRFRLLMKNDGNDFTQLLETDGGWIYWHSSTS